MYNNAFELLVCVNGKPVKEYDHNGRKFIEGKLNSRYTLKLKNNSHYKALAVFSIDGLDVLKGKPADKTKSGYIIDPYDSIEVKGYRVTDSEVAEFVFNKGQNSYASEYGNGKNNGVIGVRIYGEDESLVEKINKTTISDPYSPTVYPYKEPFKLDPFYDPHTFPITCNSTTTHTTNHIRSLSMDTSPKYNKFDLGTSWGNMIRDEIIKTEFELGDLVTEMEIYYATRKNLQKMGVRFDNSKKIYHDDIPKAFDSEYCKTPKNWNK